MWHEGRLVRAPESTVLGDSGGLDRYDRRMSSAERHGGDAPLHLFSVDDPRLWEFRSRLDDQEFGIPDLGDDEWEDFHRIIAEA